MLIEKTAHILETSKPSDQEIRSYYLQKTNQDWDVLEQFLLANNIDVTRSTEPDEEGNFPIVDVYWAGYEHDQEIFNQMCATLEESKDFSDIEFREQVMPYLDRLIDGTGGHAPSAFFEGLDNDAKPRSASHKLNPRYHTSEVVRLLNTSSLSPVLASRLRRDAYHHDGGKRELADKDWKQRHGEIAYLKYRKLLRARYPEMSNEELEFILKPVRYHHIFEQIDKGILSHEEVATILGTTKEIEIDGTVLSALEATEQNIVLTTLLTLADTTSVGPEYIAYALKAAENALKILIELRDLVGADPIDSSMVTSAVNYLLREITSPSALGN